MIKRSKLICWILFLFLIIFPLLHNQLAIVAWKYASRTFNPYYNIIPIITLLIWAAAFALFHIHPFRRKRWLYFALAIIYFVVIAATMLNCLPDQGTTRPACIMLAVTALADFWKAPKPRFNY